MFEVEEKSGRFVNPFVSHVERFDTREISYFYTNASCTKDIVSNTNWTDRESLCYFCFWRRHVVFILGRKKIKNPKAFVLLHYVTAHSGDIENCLVSNPCSLCQKKYHMSEDHREPPSLFIGDRYFGFPTYELTLRDVDI